MIETILRHCELWEKSSRAPTPDDRGLGREQDLGEIRHVCKLRPGLLADPDPKSIGLSVHGSGGRLFCLGRSPTPRSVYT